MADNPSAAWPIADEALSTKILDVSLLQNVRSSELVLTISDCPAIFSLSPTKERRKRKSVSPTPVPLLCELQTDEIFSNQNPQPRYRRTHHPRSRYRPASDSPTSSSPLRGQKCALRLRTKQECAWPSLWCVTGRHCGERDHKRFERPHAADQRAQEQGGETHDLVEATSFSQHGRGVGQLLLRIMKDREHDIRLAHTLYLSLLYLWLEVLSFGEEQISVRCHVFSRNNPVPLKSG